MNIDILSQKRGILSFYDGKKYIIFSQCMGVVAESSKIERTDDEDHHEKAVKITFKICDWCGYWDLKSIISRGIKKLENQYIKKDVKIEYKTTGPMGMNHLKKWLEVKTKKY